MLSVLAVSGYRSLRDLVIPLDRLNLVTGPNGSGKSNLYRALRLLAETAQGRVIPSLAREGGLQSTLWAGPESFSRSVLRGDHPVQGVVRKHAVSLRLGFAGDESATRSISVFPRQGRKRSVRIRKSNGNASGRGRPCGRQRSSWTGAGRW